MLGPTVKSLLSLYSVPLRHVLRRERSVLGSWDSDAFAYGYLQYWDQGRGSDMHGIRRGSRPSTEALQQERERSKFLADLIRRALVIRNTPLQLPLNEEFENKYTVVQRAVEANPDEYTLWAFRREVLIAKCRTSSPIDNEWKSELELTTRALQRHPKAYPAWQHRLWLMSDRLMTSQISLALWESALKEEQMLSAFMLSKDGRNFHGWAHRMRVRAILESKSPAKQISILKKELGFVEEKINDDFANYSAWHHRSVLLPQIHTQGPDLFLADELQFVRQAFYTEPDVQSAWFYHRWLLAGAPARGKKAVVVDGLLNEELSACEELLSIEPEARYALQTKVQILSQLGRDCEALEALDVLERIVSPSTPPFCLSWELTCPRS